MKIIVELLAFGKDGEVREVEVTDADMSFSRIGEFGDEGLAELAFRRGQNGVQPQPHPSVSMGDVVHVNGKRYIYMTVGVRLLTDVEYADYVQLPRKDRPFYVWKLEVNDAS